MRVQEARPLCSLKQDHQHAFTCYYLHSHQKETTRLPVSGLKVCVMSGIQH